jgi:hypothetical protein
LGSKTIKLTAEEYLKKVDGKKHYVWDPNSEFGNRIIVRVPLIGEFNSLMMERPISAVLVVFKLDDEPGGVIRNMVDLPSETPLRLVLNEINKITAFAKSDSKRYHKNVGEAIEAHLVPTELH